MVDELTDIPLPGRTQAPRTAQEVDQPAIALLPAFFAGPENRLVAATFRRLLDSVGWRAAPPVVALFGASGTGKTHLAHGLVEHWKTVHGEAAAAYLTASDFRRDFATSMHSDRIVEFRRAIRGHRLLAIDDLHHLPADENVWQELRYTLDALEEHGGMVLVTADRPACALGNLSPEIRSRLSSGTMLQLTAPAPATRLRIIRQTSATLGQPLASDAAQRLADGMAGTVSELLGALLKIYSQPVPSGSSDMERAQKVLSARQPTLREIMAVVARYARIPQKQLISGSRRQNVVFARALIIYLARELSGASYHQIGRVLGGRDHTTIMHSFRKIDQERLDSYATQESLNELRRLLASRL